MRKNLIIYSLVMYWASLQPAVAEAGPEPRSHQEAACSLCHDGGALVDPAGSPQVARRCLNCHPGDRLARHTTAVGADRDGQGCLDCHRFHGSQDRQAAGGGHAVGSPGLDSGHCRACHNPEGNLQLLSAAHRTAAGLYHAAGKDLEGVSPSESCLRCHASDSASPWQDATAESALGFNTHASHPYGVMVIPGAGNRFDHIRWHLDERLPLFDGKLECQTCHLLTAGTPYDLISYENPYDLCVGCHQHEATPGAAAAGPLVAMTGR